MHSPLNAGPIQLHSKGLGRVAEAYLGCSRQLFRYLLGYLRNRQDAEDILQELFEELLRKPELFLRSEKPLQYLLTACRNRAINRRLRDKHAKWSRPFDKADCFFATDQTVVDSLISMENASKLNRAFSELPDEMREVLSLRFASGMDFNDIGLVLGIPPRTAQSRMRSGLAKLREVLA